MGKGLNPADQQRKLEKKKAIEKHKKQRAETNEVRSLLNDPSRIDDELQKLRSESESNKLDLNLKNKIKEMQKMKDIAMNKLENQKKMDQLRANSLKGIQEAERHDKNLKSNNNNNNPSIRSGHNVPHQMPRPSVPPPPQQTPRPLLVGGLHGIPLPPPPMMGAPSMLGMIPLQYGFQNPGYPPQQPFQNPGIFNPNMTAAQYNPMLGVMPVQYNHMQGMIPMQGMHMMPVQYNHMQQNLNTNSRVPKRQNRPTTTNVDPLDPKGEHYVEKFIGYDRLQKQQQQQQKLQLAKQEQDRLQEEQIQEVQRIEDNDNSKWSQFETDTDKVVNEKVDDKWAMYETEMNESNTNNEEDEDEGQPSNDYRTENNNNQDDKWSKWDTDSAPAFEIPVINPEDIMKRRFAINDSSEIAATIPDVSINIEELMRRRNMIPVNEDELDVGPELGPTVPSAPYEMYESMQSLPTVEDLLQNRYNNDYDNDYGMKPISNQSKVAIGGGLLGLCQYDSDEDDDDDNDINNNQKEESDKTLSASTYNPEYVSNIPVQPVAEIESKKAAPIKIKADSALTSFIPTSLKMKRPNPNNSITSNPNKIIKTAPVIEQPITAIVSTTIDNNKDDAYAKFLAEISGLD